jgi:hypothetical protein
MKPYKPEEIANTVYDLFQRMKASSEEDDRVVELLMDVCGERGVDIYSLLP